MHNLYLLLQSQKNDAFLGWVKPLERKSPLGNAAHYFVDRHLFEGRGEKIAFREASGKKRTLTYSELAKQSSCIADAYEAQGIARENRAACILLDEIEYPIIFWGSLKCGVLPIALNTLLSTDVYDTILQDSRASILFVSHALLDVVMRPSKKTDLFARLWLLAAKHLQVPSTMRRLQMVRNPENPLRQAQMNALFGCILRVQRGVPKEFVMYTARSSLRQIPMVPKYWGLGKAIRFSPLPRFSLLMGLEMQ